MNIRHRVSDFLTWVVAIVPFLSLIFVSIHAYGLIGLLIPVGIGIFCAMLIAMIIKLESE